MMRRPVRSLTAGLISSGIALLATTMAGSPASAGGCSDVSSGRSVEVDLKSLCVIPTLIRVPGGSTVTFANRDEVNHVIVGAGFGWGSDGPIRPGRSYTATFARDGVYPFQCYLHPGMAGAVLVGDANGPGAATSFGVVVPPTSGPRATAAPSAAGGRADVSAAPTADAVRWPGVAAGILLGAALASIAAFAMFRSRPARERRPAGT